MTSHISCSLGFIQDFLDHYMDQYQILIGYFPLSFIQSTLNLRTMIFYYLFDIFIYLYNKGIEVFCYAFSKNSQLFFRIYSGFSGSLCGSMSVSTMYMSGDQSIGAFCQGQHNRLAPFEHHLHSIIEIHISNNASCVFSVADSSPALK